MRLGPACPDCAKPVPLARWSLGKVFQCSRCDTFLVMPVSNAAFWGGLGGAAFTMFSLDFPQAWGGRTAFFALMIAVILPLAWATMRVRVTARR